MFRHCRLLEKTALGIRVGSAGFVSAFSENCFFFFISSFSILACSLTVDEVDTSAYSCGGESQFCVLWQLEGNGCEGNPVFLGILYLRLREGK